MERTVTNMKTSKFNDFRNALIKEQFNPECDLMFAGYLWLSLTDRQVNILKQDVIRHGIDFTIDANTGYITVGNYILK